MDFFAKSKKLNRSLVFLRAWAAFFWSITSFWFSASFDAEESCWAFLAKFMSFRRESSLLAWFHLLAHFAEVSCSTWRAQSTGDIQEMASWTEESSDGTLWAVVSLRAWLTRNHTWFIRVGTLWTHFWFLKRETGFMFAKPADFAWFTLCHTLARGNVSSRAILRFFNTLGTMVSLVAFFTLRRSFFSICTSWTCDRHGLSLFTTCTNRAFFTAAFFVSHACCNTRVAFRAGMWIVFVASFTPISEWARCTVWSLNI